MVPEFPLAWPELGEAENAALREVLASRRLTLGAQLEAFEGELAAHAGRSGAVGTNSGTMGLQIALQALGVGPGDEVLTVSYTFVGTANAILGCGAEPVYVDIDSETLNIDPKALAAAIGPRARAILVVHLFGRPAPMDEIAAIADKHGLWVVEDACEALGARYRGRPVGGLGHAGVYGFTPNKPVTCSEGGAIIADDAELLRRCRRLRNQGFDPASDSYDDRHQGHSARLSELHAALGRVQLRNLEQNLARRNAVAQGYRIRLGDDQRLQLPTPADAQDRQVWFTFPLRLRDAGSERRDAVLQELRAAGIGCNTYFRPVHQLPFHRDRYRGAALPVSEDVGSRCLALPLYSELQDNQLDRICATLRGILSL
jgi:perosamine synthetase